MALPAQLIENYHDVTCRGQVLLSTDGYDFIPEGREPSYRIAGAEDAPDCAGRTAGELYDRGNVRWEASITRVRCFTEFEYPVEDDGITASGPVEYAQKWLLRHLDNLAGGTGGLSWESADRGWTTATVTAEGTTDAGFAVVTYSLRMTDAT